MAPAARRAACAVLAFLACARPAAGETPWYLRPILHPVRGGMLLTLPVVDTDPNRGTTTGFMPVWVLRAAGTAEPRHIFAPSVSTNHVFGVTGTYRQYFYPTPEGSLVVRASLSRTVNRELVGMFSDRRFLDLPVGVLVRVAHDRDGSYRHFGRGPDSPRSAEASYTGDTLGYRAFINRRAAGGWRAGVGHALTGMRVSDGPVAMPGISRLDPGAATRRRVQVSALRAAVTYDDRDNPVAPTRGQLLDLLAGSSQRSMASAFTFQRYSVDARGGWRHGAGPRRATVAQARFEQVTGGDVPFWALPQLGGKYSLRAYGDGRYADRGMWVLNVEERFLLFTKVLAGVMTEFEAAPFAGAGTVFDEPGRMAARYVRPVAGAAVRAVARPQVVGSVDVGIGREGPAVFMDINYSF